MDEILNVLKVLEAPMVVSTVAVLVEFLMRFVKTEKPLSIIWLVVKIIKGVSKALELIALFLDKILPQNIKK